MVTEQELDIPLFKQCLLERQKELMALLETGNDAAKPVELDQTRVGRLSRMDAMQAQAMSIEAKRRRDTELQQIDIALNRIEEGSYGYCLECDEQISIGRLKYNPAVPLCIHCAEKQE